MPLPARHFYSNTGEENDDAESNSSSGHRRCLFKSDIVIPPSEPPSDSSAPLSAPASGFSLPKTTSSGLKPPFLKKSPLPKTRFSRAVVKQQDRWQDFNTSAQEVLASVSNSKKKSGCFAPQPLPSSSVGMLDKCSEWVVKTTSTQVRQNNDILSHKDARSKTENTTPSVGVRRSLGMPMPSKLRNNNARFSLPSQIAVLKSTENLPSHCQLNDMEQSDKSAAKSPTPNTSHSHAVIKNGLPNTRKNNDKLSGHQDPETVKSPALPIVRCMKRPSAAGTPPSEAVKRKSNGAGQPDQDSNGPSRKSSATVDVALPRICTIKSQAATSASKALKRRSVEGTIKNSSSTDVPPAKSSCSTPAVKRRSNGAGKQEDSNRNSGKSSGTVDVTRPRICTFKSQAATSASKGVKRKSVEAVQENSGCAVTPNKASPYTPANKRKSQGSSGNIQEQECNTNSSKSTSDTVGVNSPSFDTVTSPAATCCTSKAVIVDQSTPIHSTPMQSTPITPRNNIASPVCSDVSGQSSKPLEQPEHAEDSINQSSDASKLTPYQMLRLKIIAQNNEHMASMLKKPLSTGHIMNQTLIDTPQETSKETQKTKRKKSITLDSKELPQRRSRSVARRLIMEHQEIESSSDESDSSSTKAGRNSSNAGHASSDFSYSDESSSSGNHSPVRKEKQQVLPPKPKITSVGSSGRGKIQHTSKDDNSQVADSTTEPEEIDLSIEDGPNQDTNNDSVDLFMEDGPNEDTNNDSVDLFLEEESAFDGDAFDMNRSEEMDKEVTEEDDNGDEEQINSGNEEQINSGTEEEIDDDQNAIPPKSTKKAMRARRKEHRNLGEAYVTDKGVHVAARAWKPPHECTVRSCHEVITPEIGNELFDEYWQQGSFDKRVAYVAARLERQEVLRKRPRKDIAEREKSKIFKYFFDINGARIQVCRSTFLSTLGETDRFVRNVTENKNKSFSGISKDDRRGKHSPAHALSDARRDEIKAHIDSFPTYVSHYCRAKTQLLYLAADLNVTKMYNLYREDVLEPVSYTTYLKEFAKTKKKFHPPKTDGCDKCDKLEIAIEGAESEEAKKMLKVEKEKHLRKAEKAYQLKRDAKASALQSDGTELLLMMDLQQCLPTPFLKCKSIFFSRQLYVFNFTIQDTVTEKTYCYMWDEVEGKRGSNEMASCLFKHIHEYVPVGVKKLTIVSDCCSGQNRNNGMCMMLFAALQEHPTLETVEHIFLIPGHTFMPEVDGKHAVIENYKRNCLKRVDVPQEWYEAVEAAGGKRSDKEGNFKVIRMLEFYDFAALAKGLLIKRDKCVDKTPFHYMKTHWFRYESQSMGVVSVRDAFSGEFRSLSFLRRGTRADRLPRILPHVKTITGPYPISSLKKKDLLGLIEFLKADHRSFYENLPASSTVPDVAPDILVSYRGRSAEECIDNCCNPAQDDEDDEL